MAHLIDRRLNDRGKSAVNRERFLRRYKTHVQEAVKQMVGERKLADMEQGGEVRVPRKDMSEPVVQLRPRRRPRVRAAGQPRIRRRRPHPAAGRRRRAAATAAKAAKATAQDDFVFSLSREEFMQIFFDDLELPRLARTEFGRTEHVQEHPRTASPRPACPRTSPSCAR